MGPEGEPGDVVEKVAVGGASPVKDRHQPGTVTGHEHVAVQQVDMQHVADLRTGIQQHREGPFTSDEGLIEVGRPGEDRAPAGHPLARPVHEPLQEPFPPAHRDGRAADGRPNLTRGRHLEMPQVVKPAQESRKKPAPPWFIQVFQEQPEVALGDRIGPAQRVAHL